eukprot:gnl/TRDRNA2_/TRDRNA2_177488_c3_seq8.p1 gnl/TRDRNA2_/TRDRNA2_177488_c3~~gnl/TRDRNA2_/TRDRNA2_177488_c3_seq8.p1  ORF type:complete len:290 (-),score=43.84 gnl/TRDRNA2_/TRDRNA2_177488_c3_seq8:202-1071(-)
MHLAACEGHFELVRELASRNANVDAVSDGDLAEINAQKAVSKYTPLVLACFLAEEKVAVKMLTLLLELRADLHTRPGGGLCVLSAACCRGDSPDLVSTLLSVRATVDLEQPSAINYTALCFAASFAGPRTVKVLLEARANPNAVTMFNGTPLSVLSTNSMPLMQMQECVKLLVDAEGDINARWSPPSMKAKILQTIGSALNGMGAKDKKFEMLAIARTQPTALCQATYWNNGPLITSLLAEGADVDLPIIWSKSADEYISQNPESALAIALRDDARSSLNMLRQADEGE